MQNHLHIQINKCVLLLIKGEERQRDCQCNHSICDTGAHSQLLHYCNTQSLCLHYLRMIFSIPAVNLTHGCSLLPSLTQYSVPRKPTSIQKILCSTLSFLFSPDLLAWIFILLSVLWASVTL